jgi:ATP/maltotriose-dependent transcriptional regulator MalT
MGLDIPTPYMLINRPRFLVGLGLVAQMKGDLTSAQGYVDQARQFAAEKAMKDFTPLIDLVQGQIYLAREEPSQALESFDRAEQSALEMGLRPMVGRARVGAALALQQLGRVADAGERQRQAQEAVQEIAGLFTNPDYRKGYLESSGMRLSVF